LAKIIVLASYAPSLLNFRGLLLERMVALGHEVIAVAPDINEKVQHQLAELGVSSRVVQLNRTGMNPLKDLFLIKELYRLHREEKADYLLSYTVKPVVYGSIAARLAGNKNIYSIITGLGYAFTESGLRQRMVRGILLFLYRLVLSWNCKVFFQNPDDLELFVSKGLAKQDQAVLVNGSGVDLQYFNERPLPVGIVNFLLLARLLAEKGIREYVEAVRRLQNKYPSVNFLLVCPVDPNPGGIRIEEVYAWQDDGVIEYRGAVDDVRSIIEQAGVYVLSSYVDDVRPIIEQAGVYVLPSYREGTPRTVLEAMAMGRPVITTDAPGCRETVVDGDNGFLVPPKDVSALVEAMEKFIKQPELIPQMGKAARKIAENKYDAHKVNREILKVMGLLGKESV